MQIFRAPCFAFAKVGFRLRCCNTAGTIRNDFHIWDLWEIHILTEIFNKPELLQRVFDKFYEESFQMRQNNCSIRGAHLMGSQLVFKDTFV